MKPLPPKSQISTNSKSKQRQYKEDTAWGGKCCQQWHEQKRGRWHEVLALALPSPDLKAQCRGGVLGALSRAKYCHFIDLIPLFFCSKPTHRVGMKQQCTGHTWAWQGDTPKYPKYQFQPQSHPHARPDSNTPLNRRQRRRHVATQPPNRKKKK